MDVINDAVYSATHGYVIIECREPPENNDYEKRTARIHFLILTSQIDIYVRSRYLDSFFVSVFQKHKTVFFALFPLSYGEYENG